MESLKADKIREKVFFLMLYFLSKYGCQKKIRIKFVVYNVHLEEFLIETKVKIETSRNNMKIYFVCRFKAYKRWFFFPPNINNIQKTVLSFKIFHYSEPKKSEEI